MNRENICAVIAFLAIIDAIGIVGSADVGTIGMGECFLRCTIAMAVAMIAMIVGGTASGKAKTKTLMERRNIMTNYFGKQRLTRILYNYLVQSAPEKLAELKRELKESGEYRKYEIRYKKYRGSEWLNTSIFFGDIEYRFEIYSFGSSGKRVTLREYKVIDGDRGDIVTETFSGFAYYDKDFNPITATTDKYSNFLICNQLQKKYKPNMEVSQ
ncbi:MAG: hypothetical protein ACI4KA_01720 [Oscillospiraceae bacterium]